MKFTDYISVMTLYEFNVLGTEQRAAVAIQGKFVDVRMEEGLKVALYSHPEFYAEVFYDGGATKSYAPGLLHRLYHLRPISI